VVETVAVLEQCFKLLQAAQLDVSDSVLSTGLAASSTVGKASRISVLMSSTPAMSHIELNERCEPGEMLEDCEHVEVIEGCEGCTEVDKMTAFESCYITLPCAL